MGRPLLLILVGVLVVVAVIAFTRPKSNSGDGKVIEDDPNEPVETLDAKIAQTKQELRERPLAGADPAVPPVLHAVIRLDPNGRRMYFDVTEEHGYYVETIDIRVWKKKTPDRALALHFDKYLKANDTLTLMANFNPFEMVNYADNSMGAAEDWDLEVECHRARAQNPDPLPPQAD